MLYIRSDILDHLSCVITELLPIDKYYGVFISSLQGLNSQQIKSTAKDIEIADLRESLTRRFEGYDSETQTVDQVVQQHILILV